MMQCPNNNSQPSSPHPTAEDTDLSCPSHPTAAEPQAVDCQATPSGVPDSDQSCAPLTGGEPTVDTLPTENKRTPELNAKVNYIPAINLSLEQNAINVIQEITLVNQTDHDLENLECHLASTSEFFDAATIKIERLKAKEELPLHDIRLTLNYQLLSTLTEPLKGKMTLEITQEGNTLLHQEHDMLALSADQWLGTNIFPELICAYVTPNLEVVNHLLSIVAEELKKATASDSIQGYQADRHRVYEICAAIYRAIHSWGISYSNPPSSFGTPGQRIRFADSIYKFRLGTCLDTTLLFASVMEQCGLHPVILIQESHAYIGCHLLDRYFPNLPLDDLQTIRKLVDLDEFVVIETTLATKNRTFSEAEAVARTEHLNIDKDFKCAIDVVRARLSGIHPLPLKHSTEGMEFEPPERNVDALGEEHKRKLQEAIDLATLKETELRSGRIARWTQKLLDLSLRNRLLNVRNTQYVIPLVCPDITALENYLAANETLTLNSIIAELGEKDVHDLAMLRNSEIMTSLKELLDNELKQKHLCTNLSLNDMSRRMTALFRQGKTDLEEGGVNTIFAGIGFLEWRVSPRDEKSYLAPILLVPIRLVRKSIVEGIKIVRLDEETIINETLLELLRSQFHLTIPGLAPLPTDKSGVDVALVMQIIRQTIKNMPGWEVREEACIGQFSFGKFIMWTDMTARAEILKKHPLVNHLMEGGGLFDDGIEVFPPDEIGKHIDPKQLYCPMSADSSQLTAVLYSTLGKSFVLHGPPGTGKSQTITNIIAQNLAMGRRVLFVSEKKAALDVVHKRLSQVGLRPFCLELHSNKSGKSEVLAQFSEALNVPETQEPAEWQELTNNLQVLREQLNDYVGALHFQYPNGFSAYTCFSHLMQAEEVPDDLLGISCLTQTREEYGRVVQLVSDLSGAFKVLDANARQKLSWLDPADWSPVFEKTMLTSAKEVKDALSALSSAYSVFCNHLGLKPSDEMATINATARFGETLKTVPAIPEALLSESIIEDAQFLSTLSEIALQRRSLMEKLKSYKLEMIRSLDTNGLEARIRQNRQAFFLVRPFKNSALLKELAGLKKLGGAKLTIEELSRSLPVFAQWNETSEKYEGMVERGKKLLGNLWQEETTDWTTLQAVIEAAQKIVGLAHEITGNETTQRESLLKRCRENLPKAIYADETPEHKLINDFLLSWNSFQEHMQRFSSDYAKTLAEEKSLASLSEKTEALFDHRESLRNFLRYKKFYEEAATSNIQGFVEALEDGLIPVQQASEAFDTAYFRRMLDAILNENHTLSQFNGLNQQQRIDRFCDLDDKYIQLSRKIVFAKLAATLPRRRSGPCPEGTELGLLKRECEKKTRQKPVRQLLSEIPTLAGTLKPCFLMSPLSVAQYLPADSAQFDLVVFDEASQIPVWDAIGVIARGKQLIVVGDPKQMPPTNFFQKGDSVDDDEEITDLEDMESILDECLAAGVHSSYLNWHYRSRHESLIAFSNHYYYEDRLFTFPAARLSERLGVRFHFVPDGIYDRRVTRTNRKEAEALVRYVFEQLEGNSDKRRSIGIVTFSEAQKNLIEDLLEAERSKHPSLEDYFSDQNEEPPFVKNLENVQGDERDVILFSIGYAPDSTGKFSMNFGPLNRQGGERRLNVAITRAKEQVVVFSSVHSYQIELSRTMAVGAAHLKYFLDYAEKGFDIQTVRPASAETENLAAVIARFLQEKGYVVERNIGCSGYRIDVAVRHPEKEDAYLLGIECDGPAYAAQKTTRDRDHIRHSVLKSLGWHLWQTWSVDWAFDRKQAENALLNALEKAKSEATSTPPATPPSSPKPVMEKPICANVVVEKPKKYYEACSIVCERPQEEFYLLETRLFIRQQMMQVIQQEAPIYERLLKKRITRAWKFLQAGKNIQSILNDCLPNNIPVTLLGEEKVYWQNDQIPEEYHEYRANGNNDVNKRAIDEIPIEELANAMLEILTDFASIEQETLFRETVRLFGLSTVTQKARKYLVFALEALRKSGKI
ncbi:MAG: DUF3320 domain-containing protein [Victivallales bacterium]|nr:DUF3320 domain-containing protein [Victivallales bacterium]